MFLLIHSVVGRYSFARNMEISELLPSKYVRKQMVIYSSHGSCHVYEYINIMIDCVAVFVCVCVTVGVYIRVYQWACVTRGVFESGCGCEVHWHWV